MFFVREVIIGLEAWFGILLPPILRYNIGIGCCVWYRQWYILSVSKESCNLTHMQHFQLKISLLRLLTTRLLVTKYPFTLQQKTNPIVHQH